MKSIIASLQVLGICLGLFTLTSSAKLLAKEQLNLDYQIEVLADKLAHPWSLAIIDEQHYLITLRAGQLLELKGSELTVIKGVPEVYAESQGGLLDILLDSNFSTNRTLYLSYAAGNLAANRLQVISAKLIDGELSEQQVIFKSSPDKDTPVHYGGRIVQLPDASLVIATGDGFDYREQAQSLNNTLGKLVRIKPDGSIPDDNPFADQQSKPRGETVNAAIWSYGHRNPQGLAWDHQRQLLWQHEHGPRGGDELNIIKPGINYGWPVITKGKDYSGALITPFESYQGMQQPEYDWTPSIAPSGLAVYYGQQFPELNGALLVGGLVSRDIKVLQQTANGVVSIASLLGDLRKRVRDISVDKLGRIYVLTDHEDGQLIRLSRLESWE